MRQTPPHPLGIYNRLRHRKWSKQRDACIKKCQLCRHTERKNTRRHEREYGVSCGRRALGRGDWEAEIFSPWPSLQSSQAHPSLLNSRKNRGEALWTGDGSQAGHGTRLMGFSPTRKSIPRPRPPCVSDVSGGDGSPPAVYYLGGPRLCAGLSLPPGSPQHDVVSSL